MKSNQLTTPNVIINNFKAALKEENSINYQQNILHVHRVIKIVRKLLVTNDWLVSGIVFINSGFD